MYAKNMAAKMIKDKIASVISETKTECFKIMKDRNKVY